MGFNLKQHAASFLEQYKEKNPATYAAAEQAIGGILIADGLFGIDNPLGGNRRPGILGTITGMILGVVFLFVPSIFNNFTHLDKLTATTQATVVSVGSPVTSGNNGSSTCSLKVHYTVDGKDYTQQSSSSSSSNCSLSEGQNITINYDPASPGFWDNDVKTVTSLIKIFFWVGLLILISSIFTFFVRLFSIIFGWKLLKDGRKNAAALPASTNLQTIIEEVKKDFTGSVFGFGGSSAIPPKNL